MSKIKNIFNLTKILFLNSFQNPYIIDPKTNKINKKSIFIWFLVIVMVALSYLSYMIVDELVKIGQPTLFLNFLFNNNDNNDFSSNFGKYKCIFLFTRFRSFTAFANKNWRIINFKI